MNLVVDIGNSLVKYGLYNAKHNLIVSKTFLPATFKKEMKILFDAYSGIRNSILSASGRINKDWSDMLMQKTNCIVFSQQTPVPLQIDYHTPETLGLDRIALAVAAKHIYPNQYCLVVDLGTCITYDFINKFGVYQGGAISPGIEMRFKAMHNFTANLPLIQEKIEMPVKHKGKTTKECLNIGVMHAVVHEINGFIKQYAIENEHLTVVLTGGNAQVLAERVKNSIFADLKFQLTGLYQTLIYNLDVHKE